MPAVDQSRVRAKKRAPRKKAAPVLVNALAEAAWADADRALAEAIAEAQILKSAPDDDAREDALALLEQALSRAARKRGLTRFGDVGAREAYDPERHDLLRPLQRAPKHVRIVASGVTRAGAVLVKARAVAIRSRA